MDMAEQERRKPSVKITTVTAKYGRKVNLGDYESADAECFVSADVRGMTDPSELDEVMRGLWRMVTNNVIFELTPMENLKRKRQSAKGQAVPPVQLDLDALALGYSVSPDDVSYTVNGQPVDPKGNPTQDEAVTLDEMIRKHPDEYDRFASAADRFGEDRPIVEAFVEWLRYDKALQGMQEADPAALRKLIAEYGDSPKAVEGDDAAMIRWVIDNGKIDA